MIIAAHQPNFIPNPAFFYKQTRVDLFVIITNLQFEKHEGWQQRHKILGPSGDIWLTVPVLGSQNQLLKDAQIHNEINWRRKHRRTLELVYRNALGRTLLPRLTAIYEQSWTRLVDVNIAFIKLIREILDINTPLLIDEEVSGDGHKLLINLCRKYGADSYLSGAGAKLYMTKEYTNALAQAGINHKMVKKNLTPHYPYSILHYLLSEGNVRTAALVKGELLV
jgi:hypothetical protein